jgi:hypothetical protein
MNLIKTSVIKDLLNSNEEFKATFTVKSLVTNKDYTFKIKRNIFNGKTYTHVYVEQNYLEFKHLGFYYNGAIIKNRSIVNTPSANAIRWLLNSVHNNNPKLNMAEIYHLGKCLKCGRTLTDANSIELGLGSHCANKI